MPVCKQSIQQTVSSTMYISVLFVVIVLCNSKLTNHGALCNPRSSLNSPYQFYQNHANKLGPISGTDDDAAAAAASALPRVDRNEIEPERAQLVHRPHQYRHQIHRHYTHNFSPVNYKQERKARAVYLALDQDFKSLNSTVNHNNLPFSNYQNDQPAVLDQCCACDEAKYELVFEGLWSRYTHPDDFPENYWLAHFSDIIGASHSNEFRMWQQDTYASEGVRELAETGSTKKLESELKLVSAKTRTIIKARELHYPTLNSKTSAVFRTDRLHHLVSILSKLGPSPDWMVGVSGLELCQSDCSWATQRVLNLYLWDAGTDSGTSFTSPDSPTRPQDKIHPFRKVTQASLAAFTTTSTTTTSRPDFSMGYESTNYQRRRSYEAQAQFSGAYPIDMNLGSSGTSDSSSSSSFNAEQSKPYARLTITRQRIYEKSCGGHPPPPITRLQGSPAPTTDIWPDTSPSYADCRVTDWSDWSTCTTACGRGLRSRIRSFVDERANANVCPGILLIQKETCISECVENLTCVTKDWSEWSNCSVNCGHGFRKRTRSPISLKKKACELVEFVEKEPCAGALDRDCEEPELTSCQTTGWSPWSNCSVACGKGIKLRTRNFIRKEDAQICATNILQKQSCTGKQDHCNRGPGPPMIGSNPNLPVIDCKLSHWGPWSTCSALCGQGKRLASRFIIQLPQNGGKPCDKKFTRSQKCKNLPPCPPSNYPIQAEQFSPSQQSVGPNNRNPSKHGLGHHKPNGGSKSPNRRTTTSTTTTQGSSMLDDDEESKFSGL